MAVRVVTGDPHVSLANGTATELKGTEAWLFNMSAVPYDPAACARVAGRAPGAIGRTVPAAAGSNWSRPLRQLLLVL